MLGIVCAALAWIWQAKQRTVAGFLRTTDQNVLLVTIDTLRADALGSYGGRAATPNLDRLARQGIRFTFAHAHAVMTLPSHASILTGRYPFEHGVRDNAGFRLASAAVTVAELTKTAGFATGAFVGAFPLDRRFGLVQGFDVYDDVGGRDVAQADFKFTERPAADVVAVARRWIEAQKGRWFAWVHVFDPHAPYAPPPPFDRQYADDPYAGEVAYTDRALEPLLDLAAGGPRPTTVVVTSDHGEALGEHAERTHGLFAYESTLHVPLIAAQIGPSASERVRGLTSDVSVSHIDILPTIVDALALQPPADLAGRTLLTSRHGEREPRVSYFEAMSPMLTRGWAPLRGVLVGREKFIDLPIEELYDLAVDPAEGHNLAAASGDRRRVLAARLESLGADLPGSQTSETAEARARLQALGYVSGSAPRKERYTEDDDPKRLVDVDRLMMDGIEFHRLGRIAEAVESYRRALQRRPDMGLAYRRLAYIQWESGALAAAISTLRQALERNGPDVEIEIRLGTYLAEGGALDEALSMLQRVGTADPENVEALNALGIAYARAGRTADALRSFGRVLALDSRNAYAHENIGTVHLQSGNLTAAAEAFSSALASDPRSSPAHAGLGVVAIQSGRRDQAIEHWRRAVELDRTNFDALFNLGTELVNAGRLADARPYLEVFVRTAPAGFYRRDVEKIRRFLRDQPGDVRN